MSMSESNRYRKEHPDHIIDSNMLGKWKVQDDGSFIAKSRMVLIGWKDPMIYQLERRSPTPTQEAIMIMLQWLASNRFRGKLADLRQAFGQSYPTNRKIKLATKMPQGVHFEGVQEGQLLQVETELYGLVSGPSWLRASLSLDLGNIGYRKNP